MLTFFFFFQPPSSLTFKIVHYCFFIMPEISPFFFPTVSCTSFLSVLFPLLWENKEGSGFLFLKEKAPTHFFPLNLDIQTHIHLCLYRLWGLFVYFNMTPLLWHKSEPSFGCFTCCLWYQQQAVTPLTLRLHSSSLHSCFSLTSITYILQQNLPLIF